MIVIRADANEFIGTGHVMRCLSIADAFAVRNREVRFATSDHSADRMIHQRGYDTICLKRKWDALDGENLDGLLELYKPELLIVDSYFVTGNYFNRLKGKVCTAYIDDLNSDSWDVDYLINYNISADTAAYFRYRDTQTKLLIGPQYAPLRKEFRGMEKHRIKIVKDILVSAGGADPEMITERIMSEACHRWKNITFHFVIGALNPRIERIKTLSERNENAVLHINERNMAELMRVCDIAISAAGSTLYELCACGLPAVIYVLADNQLLLAKGFSEKGLMLNAGDCRNNTVFINELITVVQSLIDERKKRQKMSLRMQRLIDGNGAGRLAEELLGLLII